MMVTQDEFNRDYFTTLASYITLGEQGRVVLHTKTETEVTLDDPEEVDMLERKVEALNNKMLALVNESVSSGDGIEAHESEFMTLSQETELLKQRIAAIQESTAKDNGEQSRLEQIQAIISERESKCMEYDDSIVRQMVECIKVYPGGKLEIIFGGGYLVEESV